ncbi:MAG: enoyl-ACP reductase FabV [bacterium]
MIIKPKFRGFICLTTHPIGCEAHVKEQIDYVKSKGVIENSPKKVLVIGASTGYGLASRITAAFGCQAATVGIFFEKEPSEKRPATAGWYNSVALEKFAKKDGLYAKSINGDGFSDEIKAQTVDLLKNGPGAVDLVVYSLAAPRRTHPRTGEVAKSTLKPIGQSYSGRTLDTDNALVKDVQIDPATREDIDNTISVMGGEDWEMWMDALDNAGLLANGCKSISYTYLGPKLTWPIYRDGTIGKAKQDLERAAKAINDRLEPRGGSAHIGVMKAIVTQSSSAIPVVPLYISLLFKIMKEHGTHEGPIEQMQRLFATQLYNPSGPQTDEAGRIRLDDLEMRPEIQALIDSNWSKITTENLNELTDFKGYRHEFLKLFGFEMPGVDYDADVDPMVVFED